MSSPATFPDGVTPRAGFDPDDYWHDRETAEENYELAYENAVERADAMIDMEKEQR